MDNREIAALLKEMAVYQELAGENVFKIRAFENVSRLVDGHTDAVAHLVREDRLGELKGVGKGLAEVIREIVQTGHSSELEELKASFPPGLRDILAISGLGPKKVKAIWEKLNVTTMEELEQACRRDRIAALEGFGSRSQEKILQGIELRKSYSGQFLYSEALEKVQEVLADLNASDLTARQSIAGSLRRGKSLFKDADVLLVPKSSDHRKALQERLLSFADGYPEKTGVIAAGDTKVSIIRKGMQIDFRIVAESSYPAALQHFTGSKEHNTLLRTRAKSAGMKMNEYGVFKAEEALPLNSEEDVYRTLGLSWIPPEIREGMEEIEAADRGELPELVNGDQIKGMIHVHTRYSDGLNSMRELVEECIRRGFSYLCISDHSRSAFYAGGLNIERLSEQRTEAERINRDLAPFRIFCGIESDILADGSLDYPEEVLASLDFVIGSIHSRLSMDGETATERLIKAIENPYLTMLGHPSGRLLLARKGYGFDEKAVFEALGEHEVLLEHNCHPQRLDPDWDALKRAGAMGIKISLNPDAHAIEDFDYLKYGLTMARKAWLVPSQVVNCMDVDEIDSLFRERKNRASGI